MADEKEKGLALGYGMYLSGVYIGKEPFTFTSRETGQVRTSYRWGVADGTAHSSVIYVPGAVYEGFSPMPHSDVILRVRAFPSGKNVGYALLGIADGSTLFLEDGSSVSAKQFGAVLSAAGGV